MLNWKGSDSSSYDVTHHKYVFFNKKQILFQIFFRVKNSFWCRKIFILALQHLRKRSWEFWRDLTTAWPFVPVLAPRAPKKHNNRLQSLLPLSFLECYRFSRPPGPCTLRNIRLSAKIVISLLIIFIGVFFFITHINLLLMKIVTFFLCRLSLLRVSKFRFKEEMENQCQSKISPIIFENKFLTISLSLFQC